MSHWEIKMSVHRGICESRWARGGPVEILKALSSCRQYQSFCFHFFLIISWYLDPENVFLDNEKKTNRGDITHNSAKKEALDNTHNCRCSLSSWDLPIEDKNSSYGDSILAKNNDDRSYGICKLCEIDVSNVTPGCWQRFILIELKFNAVGMIWLCASYIVHHK